MKTLFLFLGLAGVAGSICAGPVTFNATGTFDDGAALSGTVVVDTAAGVVQSADLSVSSPLSLSDLSFDSFLSAQGLGSYTLYADDGGDHTFLVILELPGTTLAGYTGGNICISSCAGDGSNTSYAVAQLIFSNLTSGSLTAVPEPGSLALCVAAGASLAWKRRRRGVSRN